MSNGSHLIGVVTDGLMTWYAKSKKETVFRQPFSRAVVAAACHPLHPRCVVMDDAGTTYSVTESRRTAVARQLFPKEKDLRLAFSSTGEFLVGIGKSTIYIADGSGARLRHVTKVEGLHADLGFAVSANRAFLVAGDHITAIDLASGEMQSSPRLVNGTFIAGVAVDASGRLLATGDPSDQSVVIRQVEKWRELGSVKGYRGWLNAIRFIPRSTRVVASSLNGDVKVWDLTRMGRRVVREQPGDIVSIIFIPGTDDILSLDAEGWLRRWNVQTLRERWKRRIAERLTWGSMAWHGADVAIAGSDSIQLVRPSDGRDLGRFEGWGPLAASEDGTVFVYVARDGNSLLVGPSGPRPKRLLSVPKEAAGGDVDMSAIVMNASGESALVATADGRVLRFDIATGRLAFELTAHRGVIHDLAISPDGRQFASAGSDRKVVLCDFASGRLLTTFSGHSQPVGAVAFSPDGKTLVSGGQDGLIRFWNVASGLPTVTFYAHAADLYPGVTALTFSPEGNRLISGGANGTIVRWDGDPVPRAHPSGAR